MGLARVSGLDDFRRAQDARKSKNYANMRRPGMWEVGMTSEDEMAKGQTVDVQDILILNASRTILTV